MNTQPSIERCFDDAVACLNNSRTPFNVDVVDPVMRTVSALPSFATLRRQARRRVTLLSVVSLFLLGSAASSLLILFGHNSQHHTLTASTQTTLTDRLFDAYHYCSEYAIYSESEQSQHNTLAFLY